MAAKWSRAATRSSSASVIREAQLRGVVLRDRDDRCLSRDGGAVTAIDDADGGQARVIDAGEAAQATVNDHGEVARATEMGGDGGMSANVSDSGEEVPATEIDVGGEVRAKANGAGVHDDGVVNVCMRAAECHDANCVVFDCVDEYWSRRVRASNALERGLVVVPVRRTG